MTSPARTALAVVVAPLATPIVVWLSLLAGPLLWLGVHRREPVFELVARANLVAAVAGVLAYAATAALSLPVYWWRRRRVLELRELALLGLALGGLPFVVYGIVGAGIGLWEVLSRPPDPPYGGWPRWWRQLREMCVLVWLGVASGTASAALYWVIAFRGDPAAPAPRAIIRRAKFPGSEVP